MTHRTINRTIAVALFVATEILYIATMAPTFSFWDCGEFIATSYTLGIPHPPGSPLFLLFGRLFTMIPFFSDIGARVNLISTLASAGSVSLTYLIILRLIILYRKSDPASWNMPEKLSAYGGGIIGALALAFSDSFWFNAVEAEVYAASSLFTALIVWIILRWYEEEPTHGNERWLLLVMYMIGLSIGVHLLSLLAVFPVALLYYFKKHEVTLKSFALLVLASSGLFFLIYIGIIKGLPQLLQLTSWPGFFLFLALLLYATWYTDKQRMPLVNTLLVSLFLIIIGYTSYGMIYVRAQAAPPINENNPSTPVSFFSYLNRDQYGDMPLWPRRWSPEPVHQYYYQHYSSDLDFFLTYQVQKMYVRYFGWQFIGREHDMEGAGVDWSVLWGIPFLVGLAGAISHFRHQWKLGLVVTALFVLSGAALVLYLNQTEPQPRERDYSYVGSFFAYALWIGIGVESIWQWMSQRLKSNNMRANILLAAFTVTAGLFLINGRMLQVNYRAHDRSGNFVPWDWAWNMLQSCEKDAILFTNGDNDTFPLWYLQEVEHIRTDIRVVNLSLANTGWYLDQLKNTRPRGAKPVAFSLSDGEIADISYVPIDSVDAVLPATFARQQLLRDAHRSGLTLPSEPQDTLTWLLKPGLTYNGQNYLRPQDIAVYEILMNNFSNRPIYFALTVDTESMIGIENYLRLDGLAYKVVPIKSADPMSYVDPVRLYSNLVGIYRYRNLNNSRVFLDETARRLCGNYTPLFIRLALELADNPQNKIAIRDASGSLRTIERGALALQVLDSASKLFPLEKYPLNSDLAGSVISLYVRLGEKQKATLYINYLEKLRRLSSLESDPRLYFVLARAYRDVGRQEEARRIIEQLSRELKQPGLLEKFETMKK
jgi:tetratricopeptide (TPR) repeat protein